MFVVSAANGDIHPGTVEGFYAQDTRFLSALRVRISGKEPLPLGSSTYEHAISSFYARSPLVDGIPEGALSLARDRMVGQGLHEDIGVFNHLSTAVELKLELRFDVDFADVFEVRSGSVRKRGRITVRHSPESGLRFVYRWQDFKREAQIVFAEQPLLRGRTAIFELAIEPRGAWYTCINVLPAEDEPPPLPKCEGWALGPAFGAYRRKRVGELVLKHRRPTAEPLEDVPQIETDHLGLSEAYRQAITDLRALEMAQPDGNFTLAAGLPWFMALFGRDSAISSLQTRLLGPRLMTGTLRTLARMQAQTVDSAADSQPGKIPHEVREGEQTVTNQFWPRRYYGSVDSTPLFVMLLGEAHRWMGDIDLARELLPAAEAAMEWVDTYGDSDGDGFVEYRRSTLRGLRNQGWKDSEDSISYSDGVLAEPPIAVAEVQGYVYAARLGLAGVYRSLGREGDADAQVELAARLKQRFNEAFWMPEAGYYAIALDASGRQVDSISSNPGHCLWTGIIDTERAAQVAERLVAPDLFSGWGVRTLSTEMARYDPVSYHNGSVWPHDNSLIAAGLARYGFTTEADEIALSMIDAADASDEHRLPELFAGYPRRELSFPVPYPFANAPQAWASGAIVHFLETLLRVEARDGRLVANGQPPGLNITLKGVTFRGVKQDL